MNLERLLRAILPDVLIDNFEVVNFEKTADRFDIWLDEKNAKLLYLMRSPFSSSTTLGEK